MKMKMKKSVSALVAVGGISLLMGACHDDKQHTANAESEVTVAGTVAKGIVKSGVVNIFGYSNGIRNTTSACETTTSSAGAYSCIVKGYVGPVAVEITASASTSMICDVPSGCGGSVGFGADYSLGSSFSLSSVVPSLDTASNVTANVTPLTDLAASVVENSLTGSTDVTATQVSQAIQEAKKKVSVLFFGSEDVDIAELPVVDITDEDAVASVTDPTVLQGATLNAAIIATSLSSAGSIEEGVSVLRTQFNTNRGIADTETTDTVNISLEEIFNSASSVVTKVQETLETAGTTSTVINAVQSTVTIQATTAATGSTEPQGYPDFTGILTPTGATGGTGG